MRNGTVYVNIHTSDATLPGNNTPGDLPAGRRGITDSIRGRIERHGGEVGITSARASEPAEMRKLVESGMLPVAA